MCTSSPTELASKIPNIAFAVNHFSVWDFDSVFVGGAFSLNSDTGLIDNTILDYDYKEDGRATVTDIVSGNIDDDEALEICFARKENDRQKIRCIDSITQIHESTISVSGDLIVYEIKLMDIDLDSKKELIIFTEGSVIAFDPRNGDQLWNTGNLSVGNIMYWGMNYLQEIEGQIWVSPPIGVLGKLIRINKLTGERIETNSSFPFSQVVSKNGKYYAVSRYYDVVQFDPITLNIIETLYTNSVVAGIFSRIYISKDGKVIIATKGLFPNAHAYIISTTNEFPVWDLGEINMYEAYMPNYRELFIATELGITKIDIKNFFDNIYKNGFE
jgi:hypothetical protein